MIHCCPVRRHATIPTAKNPFAQKGSSTLHSLSRFFGTRHWGNATVDRLLHGGVALALGVIIVTVFSQFAPFNMDEFIHYHQIICKHYPMSAVNIYREYCGAYDLNFLGTGFIVPLRSFGYTGSLPALYYYPLFLLWKSPLSARLLGYLFLLAQAGILSVLFRVSLWYTLTSLLLFFPYFFQHMVDTGPVGFHATSVFLLYFLFQKWCRTLRYRYPIVIGLTLAAGLWIKPSYLWLLPGIAMLFLLRVAETPSLFRKETARRRFLTQCCIAALIALCITGAVYLSNNPLSAVGTSIYHRMRESNAYTLTELLQLFPHLPIIQRFMNPLEATHRVFQVAAPSLFTHVYYFVIYLTLPFFLIRSFLLAPRARGLLRANCLYVLFAAT